MAKKEIQAVIYNKEDLINAIAEKNNISKAEAQKAINLTFSGFEVIAEKMNPDDKLQLVGYMSAECVHKDAYEGRNPRTKEPIPVPAKNVLKLKFGANITGKVKQPKESAKKADKKADAKKTEAKTDKKADAKKADAKKADKAKK